MMDYYPADMSNLPDDMPYICDHCGVKHDHDAYKECKECLDVNLCPSCNTCNSCDSVFTICKGGCGELVNDVDPYCIECFDEGEG